MFFSVDREPQEGHFTSGFAEAEATSSSNVRPHFLHVNS